MGKNTKNKTTAQEIVVIQQPMDRMEILSEQKFVYNYLKSRLLKKQIRNVETEKVRIQIAKSMIHGLNTMNSTLKDKQIDEMLNELKFIKNTLISPQDTEDKEEKEKNLKAIEEVEKELEKIDNKN